MKRIKDRYRHSDDRIINWLTFMVVFLCMGGSALIAYGIETQCPDVAVYVKCSNE